MNIRPWRRSAVPLQRIQQRLELSACPDAVIRPQKTPMPLVVPAGEVLFHQMRNTRHVCGDPAIAIRAAKDVAACEI